MTRGAEIMARLANRMKTLSITDFKIAYDV